MISRGLNIKDRSQYYAVKFENERRHSTGLEAADGIDDRRVVSDTEKTDDLTYCMVYYARACV